MLREAIEDTQSGIALELAGWQELMTDLDLTERRVQEHTRVVLDTGASVGHARTREGGP